MCIIHFESGGVPGIAAEESSGGTGSFGPWWPRDAGCAHRPAHLQCPSADCNDQCRDESGARRCDHHRHAGWRWSGAQATRLKCSPAIFSKWRSRGSVSDQLRAGWLRKRHGMSCSVSTLPIAISRIRPRVRRTQIMSKWASPKRSRNRSHILAIFRLQMFPVQV